ncbi:hypothetical protein GWI33_010870 [Rhynchophorus ferrugineus]|uniref:Uncharacterized protein n=1 Tax=Rhynchophorus ferrugineus TaxID=354439 RepID=A0A834ICL7_RHYFE|nr:hypothetical protein GWI33_010870 [Rhynchophorus ferrugineus]
MYELFCLIPSLTLKPRELIDAPKGTGGEDIAVINFTKRRLTPIRAAPLTPDPVISGVGGLPEPTSSQDDNNRPCGTRTRN